VSPTCYEEVSDKVVTSYGLVASKLATSRGSHGETGLMEIVFTSVLFTLAAYIAVSVKYSFFSNVLPKI